MRIEFTNIPNVVSDNINESKMTLAENIIKNVYPLFDDVYSSKVEGIDKIKKELQEKKEEVQNQKKELENLMFAYKKQKKVSKLLDRIERLIHSGLVYDGTLRHEMTVLLKVINKLDEQKLDFHLQSTLQIISKRFSK